MSKASPARYRTTSWSSYKAALRAHGSLLIWLDKDMTWLAPHDAGPGCLAVFSDAAIQFCLTIKGLFKLRLRQTAGMVASLLDMANLDRAVPDYTTLCRRQMIPAVQIPEVEEIGTETADGAYDTRRCHTAIIDRQAPAIIPIRKSGRPWKED